MMTLKADQKYSGVIASGSSVVESQNGTLSFQVMIECSDGETSYPIWLTDKNRDKAVKLFEMLGADTTKLGNSSYLEYELGIAITGKEISFGTKEEEYNGKRRIKVSWIGKKTDPNVYRGAAKFFGGTGIPVAHPDNNHDPITDEDVPF
jgi:hypothetical protein